MTITLIFIYATCILIARGFLFKGNMDFVNNLKQQLFSTIIAFSLTCLFYYETFIIDFALIFVASLIWSIILAIILALIFTLILKKR